MSQGEFYGTNEYNTINEYKHFPAEMYQKTWEENECGREEADLGKETASLQSKPQRIKQSGQAKTLIDKLFHSVRGVATAATVAAASTVVVTTLVTSAPQAELVGYECGDTYIEYEMQVSGLEEDGEYAIVLSTTNEEDKEVELNDDGVYRNRIEGLKPQWEYTLSLVQYDSLLGEIRHFEANLQTLKHSNQEPIPPPAPEPMSTPSVTVTDTEIVGINKIRLYFTHSDLPDESMVEFDVQFGDLSLDRIVLTPVDIERGYVELWMEASASLTVTPSVIAMDNGEDVKTVCAEYTHIFEETFQAEVMVGLYEQVITVYPVAITGGAERISVTSSLAPDTPELVWLEDAVNLWYDTAGVITYTMYLSNDDGDILSNVVTVTVDTAVTKPTVDFGMNYKNPGDVCITYNDDGSINLYIQTDFEAQSEDLYYQITVGGVRYTSREPLARIEHIPDQSYSLTYDVCIDVNGVPYSIYRVTPSGMLNEPYFYWQGFLQEKAVLLQLYKDAMYLDLSSVRLVSSQGEEILLGEADFVYNAVTDSYDLEIELSEYAEEATVFLVANPYYEGLEQISYIGNVGKIIEITLTQL